MPRRPALALMTLAAAACVSPSGVERVPIRAADFRPAEVRQPAVVVRVTFDGGLSIPEDAGLTVTDLDADCDDPRASRRLPTSDVIASAVARLLTRVVGP